MKIGIIGAGSIAQTYGRLWHEAGHDIMLSARNLAKAETAAGKIGLSAGSASDAAAFGDVILLAVNYPTLDSAIDAIGAAAKGKLVIDATNPLRWTENGGTERVIGADALAAELTAARLPEARIAKSFTTLWTEHVENHSDRANPAIAMPLAADAKADRDTVAALISDAGLVPVDLGPLSQSRPLDPPSPIWNVVLTPAELLARINQATVRPAAA